MKSFCSYKTLDDGTGCLCTTRRIMKFIEEEESVTSSWHHEVKCVFSHLSQFAGQHLDLLLISFLLHWILKQKQPIRDQEMMQNPATPQKVLLPLSSCSSSSTSPSFPPPLCVPPFHSSPTSFFPSSPLPPLKSSSLSSPHPFSPPFSISYSPSSPPTISPCTPPFSPPPSQLHPLSSPLPVPPLLPSLWGHVETLN